MSEIPDFAELAFAFGWAESAFEDRLCDFVEDFSKIGWDHYDISLEIYEASDDARLTEEAQKFIYDSGFRKCYVNHKDKWQTHYSWSSDFSPHRGWRRKDKPGGGFLISYFPESWGDHGRKKLSEGYFEVIPDPLETAPPREEDDTSGGTP